MIKVVKMPIHCLFHLQSDLNIQPAESKVLGNLGLIITYIDIILDNNHTSYQGIESNFSFICCSSGYTDTGPPIVQIIIVIIAQSSSFPIM